MGQHCLCKDAHEELQQLLEEDQVQQQVFQYTGGDIGHQMLAKNTYHTQTISQFFVRCFFFFLVALEQLKLLTIVKQIILVVHWCC